MFGAHKSDEIKMPKALRAGAFKYWANIEVCLFLPWFLVVYKVSDDDYIYTRTELVSKIETLINFTEEFGCDLIEVSLASPGRLNHTNRWKLEPLKEIKVGFEPELTNGQDAKIYILKNGKQYIDSSLDTPLKKLKNVESIFRY